MGAVASHLVTWELVNHASALSSTKNILSVGCGEGPGNLIRTLEVLYQTVRDVGVSALVAFLFGILLLGVESPVQGGLSVQTSV